MSTADGRGPPAPAQTSTPGGRGPSGAPPAPVRGQAPAPRGPPVARGQAAPIAQP
jgi:hypothetical protein